MRPDSFSTQRKAGMSSLEPSSSPACEAPVCDERSVSHSREPVGTGREPACHLGRVAVADGALQHRPRQTVDLQIDDAGNVGHHPRARAPRDALRDAQRVDVLVVGTQEHLEHDRHGGGDQRHEQRPEEPVHLEGVVGEVRRDPDHPRVEDEDEQKPDDEHVRQPQRGDERRQQGVEDRDQRRGDERAQEPLDADAGHDHRGDVQRESADHPLQQHPPCPDLRPARRPPRGHAVSFRLDLCHLSPLFAVPTGQV